jgi:hypothetical protein
MSLEKFGFTNSKESVPPEKKAKIDKKTRHKIYDDEKRVRTFAPTWTETYLWVKLVEGKMYCNLCKEYPTLAGQNSFVYGSTTFHISNLKSDKSSRAHLMCMSRYNSDNA